MLFRSTWQGSVFSQKNTSNIRPLKRTFLYWHFQERAPSAIAISPRGLHGAPKLAGWSRSPLFGGITASSTSVLCVCCWLRGAALMGFPELGLVWRGGLRLPFPTVMAPCWASMPWPGMEGQVGAAAWGGS